ncbi:MAG: response regulator, partial [Cyclobacteriaceae bacterium]|nr:response regulator [Cyclobacteriaceae bacterium]
GIGLSLVKELCNLSHGEIVVKSTPNELTSFKAILPVGKHHFKNNELDKESKYEISGFIPKTNADRLISSLNENNLEELPVILVVEDHVEIREFLVGILSKEYNVLNADNGKTGVELAFEHIPDLIISDVIMPAMDGFDLCKTIKSDERTSHVPVILLTAREGDENKLIGLENGADDYLIKPFSIALLKARVKNLIELRKKLIFSFNKNPDLNGKKEEYLNTMDQTFMKKIEEILRRNIKNPDFTVELFSNEANLSRMQFHRKVKAITGHSANAIIRTERLKLACKLLSESKDGNIADVAYESGFSDASYFAKCFKETYNCTPKEYAKSQANSN